jgi:purine-binding chemotaxis protein CheW
MQRLFLIAVIAGTEVAISSECIESVVTVGEVIDVPQSDPLVAGLIALRSRVLTLIDCQYVITSQRNRRGSGSLAIIASVGGHAYALLVDAVKDVVSVDEGTIKPASKLDPRWAAIVRNVVEVDGRIIMNMSPETLLMPHQALAA